MQSTAMTYFDGSKIVLDEEIRKKLSSGQRILLTFDSSGFTESRTEKRKRYLEEMQKKPELTTRGVEEIDQSIRESRENDRF